MECTHVYSSLRESPPVSIEIEMRTCSRSRSIQEFIVTNSDAVGGGKEERKRGKGEREGRQLGRREVEQAIEFCHACIEFPSYIHPIPVVEHVGIVE